MSVGHHLSAALTATIVSILIVVVAYSPAKQVVHSINASKHAWPDLTVNQKNALAAAMKGIPGLKLDIVCGDGACTDLAQDIDDAAEQAGVESILDHPVTPLGYGIGVKSDAGDDRAQKIADALSASTAGALQAVVGTDRTFGYAIIYIGKHKD